MKLKKEEMKENYFKTLEKMGENTGEEKKSIFRHNLKKSTKVIIFV